jgi:HEPN domain-containing protein
MSPEAERAAEVREWLGKAALDLRGARIDLDARPPLLEDALFHCQQAVEKTLKAFLVWHDKPFRKTHSLEEIGRACCAIDAALTDLVDEAVPLTEYAWAFRYPGAPPVPTAGEAHAALDLAIRVGAAIVARLSADAVPAGFPQGSS